MPETEATPEKEPPREEAAERRLPMQWGPVVIGVTILAVGTWFWRKRKSMTTDQSVEVQPGPEWPFGAPAEERAKTRTALSVQEGRDALARGFERVTGRAPTETELRMLVSQWALETANGHAVYNYNFGNVTTKKSGGPYYIIPGITEYVGPGGEGVKKDMVFRAYESADDGAYDYVRRLALDWPKAFALLGSGDTAAYGEALKHGVHGVYYTASLEKYQAGLADRYNTVADPSNVA